MGGKGNDPPPPPNYTQVAQQQAVENKQALAQQTWSNRPNQYSPWGSTIWNANRATDPATGQPVTRWTQTSGLDPVLDAALRNQFGVGGERSAVAADLSGRLADTYGTPMDWGQFREVTDITDPTQLRQQAEDAAYLRATNRLDPQWQQQASDIDIQLRNQGLVPGDEAYDRAMGNFNRARNDAYEQARLASTGEGRAEAGQMFEQMRSQQAQSAALRQQEITEALQQRGMDLDEINLLLAGQGVQPAAQPGYTTAGMAQPANLMGAAAAQYGAAADAWNAQQAQRQGMMSGVMQGASLIPMAYSAGMFSDRRFKTDVVQVGTFRGYPWYRFNYVWGEPGEGVMADEVNPEAVTDVGGYAFVDYARIQ